MFRAIGRVLSVSLVFLIALGSLVQGAGPGPQLLLGPVGDPPAILYLPYIIDNPPMFFYLPYITNNSKAPFDLPTLQFSQAPYPVDEGADEVTVVVTLSAVAQDTVSVDYATADGTATAGSDYVAASGRLSFAPGQTSQSFTVPILGDEFEEPDETFHLALSNSSQAFLGWPRTALVTIVDDDKPPTVQFDSSLYSAHEGAGVATIAVTLSAVAGDTVSVDYATSDGTATAGSDYVATSGTLTFAPGKVRKTFAVTINDDSDDEEDETIRVALSSVTNAVLGTPSVTTLTIVDDDEPPTVQFGSSSYSVSEGAGTATIVATLSAVAVDTVRVNYATSNGTATAGSDYVATSGTLSFAPGEVRKTFAVTVNDDAFDEGDETVRVTLSSVVYADLGTPSVTTLTIVDDDEPPTVQFSSSSYSVSEGAGTATIVATLSAEAADTVRVNYATSNGTATAGSDYVAASGTLSFAPGEVRKTFAVTVNDDAIDEGDETVRVTLSSVVYADLGTPSVTTLTIVDDDEPPTVQFGSSSYSVSEGAGTATIVATLSAEAADTVRVNYATSNGTATAGSDYVATSGTLSFAPGEVRKTFAVTVNDDSDDEEDETIGVALSSVTNADMGTPSVTTLTIVDDDEPPTVQFGSSSYSVSEGAGTATIVATLSAASQDTVSVDYATSNGTATAGSDYVAASGRLSFAPGQTSRSFVVTVVNDSLDEASETVNLSLSDPVLATLGAPSTAALTIVDNDGTGQSYFGVQIGAIHEVLPESVAVAGDGSGPVLSSGVQADVRAAAYSSLVTALRESGAHYARIYLEWDQIEPQAPVPGQPPSYGWGWFDSKLSLIAETGVEMVIIVADAPSWAADRQCAPFYPDRLDEFARFLTDLVNRYKGAPYNVKYWELINEPDWNGTGSMAEGGLGCWGYDADRYADMLAVAYPAIKAADPGATVLMGGLAHEMFEDEDDPNWRFLRYFPDQVMQHGGGANMDALNIHAFPYFDDEWQRWSPSNRPTCGIVDDGAGPSYEAWGIDIMAKINHFRNRMSTCHQVNKPLWITETGLEGLEAYPSTLIDQARYAIQGNVRAVAAGAEAVIWFALSTKYSQWQYEGLLFDDWTPKPAFYAFQTLTSELDGYTFARNMYLSSPNEAYVFRNASGQEKTVIWTTGWSTQTLSFGSATRLRIVDREGRVTFIQDGGAGDLDGSANGAVRLLLSRDPVFVTVVS